MQRHAIVALVVVATTGCAGLLHGPGVEPGTVEVEVSPWEQRIEGTTRDSESALFFAARLNGPYNGQLREVALERDGKTVASAKPKNVWVNPGAGEHQRIGSGHLWDSGILGTRDGADLLLAGVQPGRHTLVLRFRGNLQLPMTARLPIDLERVPSTSGEQLAVSSASHLNHATIRFETESLFGERERAPTDQFWMTIPVDVRQKQSRVDVLWYHGGALRGAFTRELSPGPVGVGKPFQVPVRMWGWPEDLPKEQVYATSGDWSIHVIQDGQYLTTCRVSVALGRFSGRGATTRVLPCAPDDSDATADARSRARRFKGHRPDARRSREVMALHRSPETREVLLALGRLERDNDQVGVMSMVAAADKETAITERQWKNAERRQELAWSDRDAGDAEYRALRRRYDRLVAKYGR